MILVKNRKKVWLFLAGFFLILLLMLACGLIASSSPLTVDGVTKFNNGKSYDISVSNHGHHGIRIEKIVVNGKEYKDVQLVESYSLQLVSGGTDMNPNTKISDIHHERIRPKLSSPEIQAIMNGKDYDKPIFYGIRMNNIEQEVTEVIINYHYLGFSKTRSVRREFFK